MNNEKVEYINKTLRGKKKGFKKIAEEFETSIEELEKSILELGYIKIRVKNINQFVLESEHYTDDIHKENIEHYTHAIQPIQEPVNAIISDGIDIKDLKEIISMKDELKAIIQSYSERIALENAIEIHPIEIRLDNKIGATGKAIGVRVDEEVYKEWVSFTKDHNKTFKSHQLLSQALLEFINKYK